MYLECINENHNTLILNQEMTYFIIREILKKMDRSVNKRHVNKKYKIVQNQEKGTLTKAP